MKTKQILKELEGYLSRQLIYELKSFLVLKGKIIICLTVADIIKTYNSTQENEDIVCQLLSLLLRNHFNSIKHLKR